MYFTYPLYSNRVHDVIFQSTRAKQVSCDSSVLPHLVSYQLTCEILGELLLELGVAFALLLCRIKTEVGHELPANGRTTRELAFKTSRARDAIDAQTRGERATHMIISGAIALM